MKKLSLQLVKYFSAMLFVLALGSCSPNQQPLENGDGSVVPQAGLDVPGAPALPLLDSPRAPSVSESQTIEGVDTYKRSPLTDEDHGGLVLFQKVAPTWGMYQFGGLDDTDSTSLLTVHLYNDIEFLPQQIYVGVSDYAKLRWVWTTVTTPTAFFSLPLPAGSVTSSPAGNLYVVVLCMNDSAVVQDLTLDYHVTAPPPVDLQASDGTLSSGVQLDWTDPAITYAGDPDFAYEEIAIERSPTQNGVWGEVARVPAGTSSMLDASAVVYAEAQKLYYRLRTVRDGSTGQPGPTESGWVNALPIVNLNPHYDSLAAPGHHEQSAAGSYDPDGGPLNFEWDFIGDDSWYDTGTVDHAGHDYDGFVNTVYPYSRVRVTDDEGNATVERFWVGVYGHVRRWEVATSATYADASLDGAGNTYINYRTLGGGPGVVAKYDKDCAFVWARQWDDSFEHIVCAPNGSYYLYETDRVARFDSAGNFQWARTATPAFNAFEAKVDAGSNLWLLCGVDIGLVDELQVLCIAADGSVVFRERFDDPGGGNLTCAANRCGVTFDVGGNAYVAATLVQATNHALVIKLAPDGSYIWQEQIVTPSWDSAAVSICGDDRLYLLTSEGNGKYGFMEIDPNSTLLGSWETTDLINPRRMFRESGAPPKIEIDGGYVTTHLSWMGYMSLRGATNLSGDSLLVGAYDDVRFVFASPITTSWVGAGGGSCAPASYAVEETLLTVDPLTQDFAPFTLTEDAAPQVTEGSGQTVCRFEEEPVGEPGGPA